MKRNAFLMLLLAMLPLVLPSCARVVAAGPDSSGEIEIVLSDYQFEPEVIRLKVGQTVHLKLRNEGDKMHEFMAGRDVQIHGNFTEGFGEDFFAGITPEIAGPGMVMGMEGMDMGGMAMEEGEGEMDMEGDEEHAEDEEHTEGEMDMGEGEDEHAEEEEHDEGEMSMEEGEHTEEDEHAADEEHTEAEGEEHDEEAAADGEFGAIQRPLMDAHAGLMVMIDPQMVSPGEVTTVTFTVPEDKVGRWQFGCFQERGQHYDDGMNGIIIVER